MRGAIAIAMREIHDRRMVLAAAAVAGFLPFAMPLVPGVRPDDARPAIDVAAILLALGVGAVFAVSLGATAIGRDLANRRLGFDLARPVSELAVWAGRLGAAALLAAAAMALAVLPALVAGGLGGGFHAPDDAPAGVTIAVAAGLLLLLVPLAHVAGVVARSRSRWLAVDAVAAAVVLVIAAAAVRRVVDVFAVRSAVTLALAGVVAAIPAVWIATAAQVVRGRCDLAAGHRAQSLTLWPLLALVAIGMHGYAFWFVAADPADLVHFTPKGAPSGEWIAVSGSVKGRGEYRPTFLLEPGSGRSIRLGADGWGGGEVLFSADGSRAVWIQRDSALEAGVVVRVVDLDEPEPRVRETHVRFSALLSPVRSAVSPTGRRLAGVQHRTLTVTDLGDGRLLASVRLPEAFVTGYFALTFVGEDTVRAYRAGDEGFTAVELDVPARRLRTLGDDRPADGGVAGNWFQWAPGHDRVMVIDGWGERVTILDGHDLSPSWRLPDLRGYTRRSADFLYDGRVVSVVVGEDAPPTVTVYGPDGAELRRVEIDAPADVPALGHEIRPGVFLVGLAARESPQEWGERRLYTVDAATGEVRRVEGVTALPFRFWWTAGWAPPEPGSARALLLAGDSCDAVLLDPDDLSTRRVVGGTCPPRDDDGESER